MKRQWERNAIVDGDFGDLPDVLTAKNRRGGARRLYPRLTVVDPFMEQLNRMPATMSAATSIDKRTTVEAFFWMIEE